MEFEISDASEAFHKRDEWERHMLQNMTDKGYVPVLDIPPQVMTKYDQNADTLLYRITIQAIYVGKKKSKEFVGICQGKLMRDTPESK